METNTERERLPLGYMSRINWGAIIGGTIIGIFFQIFFALLGLAIGITAFRPGEPITLQTGMATGTYLLVISVISVFIGAFASGRFAGFVSRYDGVFHGIATLALLTVISLLTVTSAVAPMIGNTLAYMAQTNRIAQFPQYVPFVSKVGQVPQEGVEQQPTGAAAPMSAQDKMQIQKNMAGASWTAFLTALLSLAAAIIGGILGIRSRIKGMRKEILYER